MSKKRFSILVALALAMAFLTATAWRPPVARAIGGPTFSDIAGHWAESMINQGAAAGYINGYPDGTFRPQAPVTRAELVKMMVGAGQLPTVDFNGATLFQDVADHWIVQQGYLGRAWTYGVVDPGDGNTFDPNQPATRIFTAVAALRLLGRQGGIDQLANTDLPFTDAASLPAWAHGWVKQATLDKIMTGYPDGSFRAQQPVTRAEAVAIVQRTLAAMTVGINPKLQLTVDGQSVTPPVPLAVHDGYVYAPAKALYGAIPNTVTPDWPTGMGVTPGNDLFRFGPARLEFVTGADYVLQRTSDQQFSYALGHLPLSAPAYRLYGQLMIPVASAGGSGNLPFLSVTHDAVNAVVRVTRGAGWPGDSLPTTMAAARLCSYAGATGAIAAGQEYSLTAPQYCDAAGNELIARTPVALKASVDPSGPLRLRATPDGPLVTDLTIQSPWDGSHPTVAVPAGDAAVPEGTFAITFTAPTGQSIVSNITVSDHRPVKLIFDPVPTGAIGQPVTITMRLVDRYSRVVPVTTESGPSLTVTDPYGNLIEATPKTSSGSLGLEHWILTNGMATYTVTPPYTDTYQLKAHLHMAPQLTPPLPAEDFDAAATLTVK